MSVFFPILIFVALGAVLIVLVMGLIGLAKGGHDRSRSNRLMQWRIALQFLAIAILLLAVLASQH